MKHTLKRRIRRAAIGAGLVGAAVFGVWSFYPSQGDAAPKVNTARVTRGRVANEVSAIGTLQPLTTVQVGSQVSGRVSWLGADFNSIVRRGQVIARLDPSLFQTQVEQSEANLARATADLERARMQLADAQRKYDRAAELSGKGLIPLSDLDAATLALANAGSQVKSSEAAIVQAEAALNQVRVSLAQTIITAPIDGIVIQRSVDVGQTVAASMSAPTLFSIAADLQKMQVSASIDESDIGSIRPEQAVEFQVDAYPEDAFTGTVSQVRLQPAVTQNVTTYNVIIHVPNPELKLKPGMTANVKIAVALRDEAIRVPNAALRFRPTTEVYAALGQTAPARDAARAAAAPPRARDVVVPAVDGEEEDAPAVRRSMMERNPQATTIDALFGPLESPETEGRVWRFVDGRLEPVNVRLGISDGQATELLDGDLELGTELVTSVTMGEERPQTATPAGGIFMNPGGGGNRFPAGGRRG